MQNEWSIVSETDFTGTCNQLEKIYEGLPKQLIHRDVHSGNFLFENNEFSGYIDFDLSQKNIRIIVRSIFYQCGRNKMCIGCNQSISAYMQFGRKKI